MHAFGGPEVLSLDDVDVREPGPGEVQIKVGAIGLNRAETMILSGAFGQRPLPSIIGYECAGVIRSVGRDVNGFMVGDHVAILPGLPTEYGACGETVLCPADLLVKSPDGQSDLEAAATWMQFVTAYAVRAYRRIESGDAVIITAGSSSVGLAATQLVAADGGVPIVVTRGRGKVAALKQLGAAHVIVSDEQNVAQAVREITGGRGAAMAFDAVAGPSFPSILSALAPGGLAIVYGALGGEPTQFSAPYLEFLELTIRGYGAHHLVANSNLRREAIAYIRERLADGRFRPIIDRTFGLSEIAKAYGRLLGNQQIGKIVVTV
jgi:NADPH:quinone reductase-like Zn-dependent oxidoreductase